MHHKEYGGQQFMHALSVSEARVFSYIAEENILHHLSGIINDVIHTWKVGMSLFVSLDVVLSEELDVWEGAYNVLADQLTQLIVLEKPVPGTLHSERWCIVM